MRFLVMDLALPITALQVCLSRKFDLLQRLSPPLRRQRQWRYRNESGKRRHCPFFGVFVGDDKTRGAALSGSVGHAGV
jgi:hypothetical protein